MADEAVPAPRNPGRRADEWPKHKAKARRRQRERADRCREHIHDRESEKPHGTDH